MPEVDFVEPQENDPLDCRCKELREPLLGEVLSSANPSMALNKYIILNA